MLSAEDVIKERLQEAKAQQAQSDLRSLNFDGFAYDRADERTHSVQRSKYLKKKIKDWPENETINVAVYGSLINLTEARRVFDDESLTGTEALALGAKVTANLDIRALKQVGLLSASDNPYLAKDAEKAEHRARDDKANEHGAFTAVRDSEDYFPCKILTLTKEQFKAYLKREVRGGYKIEEVETISFDPVSGRPESGASSTRAFACINYDDALLSHDEDFKTRFQYMRKVDEFFDTAELSEAYKQHFNKAIKMNDGTPCLEWFATEQAKLQGLAVSADGHAAAALGILAAPQAAPPIVLNALQSTGTFAAPPP